MGKKEAARQKQLAKKKAKRNDKRKEVARRTSHDPTVALAHAAGLPVYDAQIPGDFGSGMGYALIARRLPDGRIAFASFVVDTFCLGVKDCFWTIKSPVEYQEFVGKFQSASKTRKVSAECAAKLVFGAVEYARSLGFPPHADYRHAGKLLEGINPTTCTEEFEFGRNGRPVFIQGPYDTPARIAQVMAQLQDSQGSVEGLFEPVDKQMISSGRGTSALDIAQLYADYELNKDSDDNDFIEHDDQPDQGLLEGSDPDRSK